MTTTKAGSGVKTPSIVTDQYLGVAGGPNPLPRRYNVYRRCPGSSSRPIIAGSAPRVANNAVNAGLDRRSGTGGSAASTRNTVRRDGRSPPSSHRHPKRQASRPMPPHSDHPPMSPIPQRGHAGGKHLLQPFTPHRSSRSRQTVRQARPQASLPPQIGVSFSQILRIRSNEHSLGGIALATDALATRAGVRLPCQLQTIAPPARRSRFPQTPARHGRATAPPSRLCPHAFCHETSRHK
ncbi:hypothetical protein C7453_101551 [Gluconacetobacter liquefaciens]|uniref:Uncharacterized protein n=1 Tax=Gluconacetobacter liquefaciens TaxID=89584 RepID=A0A370GA81_GLULI|nr:hypothetical protein C7453_101551 [Gluconacetobacter liquefaciens]